MKKITLYRLINIVLIATYIVSLIVQEQTPIFDMQLQDYWFPVLCIFVSASMLIKGILFKSDSSVWLFVVLLLVGSGIVTLHFNNISFYTYWSFSLLIPSIASLIVGLIFKIMFQMKVSIVLALLFVPLFCYSFQLINIWWFIGIMVASLWCSIISVRVLPQRWNRR